MLYHSTLHLPKEQEVFKMVSIDPGTRFMGVAIYEVNFVNRHILDAKSECWHVDDMTDLQYLSQEDYTYMTIKLTRIRKHFGELLLREQPVVVACERPFFNRFKPNAFAAILRVLESIQSAIIDYNPNVAFVLLEPFVVKKRVGASLSSDKEKVREALQSKDEFKRLACYDELANMEKDAIDALAVGYAYIDESKELLLNNPIKGKK